MLLRVLSVSSYKQSNKKLTCNYGFVSSLSISLFLSTLYTVQLLSCLPCIFTWCYSTPSFTHFFFTCSKVPLIFPLLFVPLPTSVSIYPVLIFSDKLIRAEAALLPVWIEGSHRRPSIVHLINQTLLHGAAETCICSDGACSYTSPIVINRARSSERGLCSVYWLLYHISKEVNSWVHRV